MNLLLQDGLEKEKEYMFAPYSVFRVVSVQRSARAHHEEPHVVVLEAAVDNAVESEVLPLAAWY